MQQTHFNVLQLAVTVLEDAVLLPLQNFELAYFVADLKNLYTHIFPRIDDALVQWSLPTSVH